MIAKQYCQTESTLGYAATQEKKEGQGRGINTRSAFLHPCKERSIDSGENFPPLKK